MAMVAAGLMVLVMVRGSKTLGRGWLVLKPSPPPPHTHTPTAPRTGGEPEGGEVSSKGLKEDVGEGVRVAGSAPPEA